MKLWIILLLIATIGATAVGYCVIERESPVPPLSLTPAGFKASGGCGASGCHANTVLGTFPPKNLSHMSRITTASVPRGHVYMMDCQQCHYRYDSKPTHKDGTLNRWESVFFLPDAYTEKAIYNKTTGTCSGSGCHVEHPWGTKTDKFNTINNEVQGLSR